MKEESLIRFLRGIMVGFGILGALVYTQVFPILGHMMEDTLPNFEHYYMIWLIFIWLSAIPCYIILSYGWTLTSEMERKTIFTHKSAKCFKKMSYWALADTCFFALGNFIFLILKSVNILYFFTSLVGVFIGFTVIIATAFLSYVTYQGAVLREENELTI